MQEQIEGKTLSLTSPADVMDFGKKLSHYIKENKLSIKIGDSEYAYVDGWKFALLNFGLVPMAAEPERIEAGKTLTILYKNVLKKRKGGGTYQVEEAYVATTNKDIIIEEEGKYTRKKIVDYFAYKCTCTLVNVSTGVVVGSGSATCSNAEVKKALFDEYSVFSMAQTRAIGKAARNLIGYIMKAAGLESTPAEEMDGKETDPPVEDWSNEIANCKNMEDLEMLWANNPGIQKDAKIKALFTNQKNKLKNGR